MSGGPRNELLEEADMSRCKRTPRIVTMKNRSGQRHSVLPRA